MSFIRVFRVEHREHHFGPYRINKNLTELPQYKHIAELSNILSDSHLSERTHPCGLTDRCETINKAFGFSSTKKLKIWFDGFLGELDKLGFVCKEFRVLESEVKYGISGKQLAFKRPLTPVRVIRLTSL